MHYCVQLVTTLTGLLVLTIANFTVALILKPLHTLDSDSFRGKIAESKSIPAYKPFDTNLSILIILFLLRLNIFSVFIPL